MQLSSFTDYGLRSLMYLAKHPDRRCSVKEISEYYGISRHHLVKVIYRLVQLGYVDSYKGKGGGIQLAQHAAKELLLGDLVKQLETNLELVECFNPETNTCRITDTCLLKHFLYEANVAFITALNKYKLADAIKLV